MSKILIALIFVLGLTVGVSAWKAYAQDVTIKVEINNTKRIAHLHLPTGFDRSKSYPLVIGFHGLGGNATNYIKQSQINAKGEKAGFLVLCPEGVSVLDNHGQAWNSGTQDFINFTHNVDDEAFIRTLIAKVSAEYPVDRKRIYATGFSNRGQMSFLLALDMADIFAAIAPMSGARLARGLKPSRPVPVLYVHGAADNIHPMAGGQSALKLIHEPLPPIEKVILEWCLFDHASINAQNKTHAGWQLEDHGGASPVEMVTVNGLGHQISYTPDAMSMALEFFTQHPMP